MVVFPHAKINLGLHILRKRPDGYHDLETVFYPLPVNDVLEGIKVSNVQNLSGDRDLRFSKSGDEMDSPDDQNLCVKAFHLLKTDFPGLPPVQLHLHKAIPMGAGLGGGSSDGACTLQLLNQLADLNLTQEKLIDYALQLGSDCPYFIIGQPCLGTGRGELLRKIGLDLSIYSFVLVFPGIRVSTAWAFTKIVPGKSGKSIEQVIHQPIETWRKDLTNEFETPVSETYPEIKMIKDKLYSAGALYASLSGSGSAVYGIFSKNRIPSLFRDTKYLVREIL